jgi:hypothetical protein
MLTLTFTLVLTITQLRWTPLEKPEAMKKSCCIRLPGENRGP